MQFRSYQLHFFLSGKAPSLLFPTGGELRHLALDGNGTGSYGAVAHSQGSLGALDVWWEQELVFWTDSRRGTIKRSRITGDRHQGLLKLPWRNFFYYYFLQNWRCILSCTKQTEGLSSLGGVTWHLVSPCVLPMSLHCIPILCRTVAFKGPATRLPAFALSGKLKKTVVNDCREKTCYRIVDIALCVFWLLAMRNEKKECFLTATVYREFHMTNLVPSAFSLAWPRSKPGKRSWERGCHMTSRTAAMLMSPIPPPLRNEFFSYAKIIYCREYQHGSHENPRCYYFFRLLFRQGRIKPSNSPVHQAGNTGFGCACGEGWRYRCRLVKREHLLDWC